MVASKNGVGEEEGDARGNKLCGLSSKRGGEGLFFEKRDIGRILIAFSLTLGVVYQVIA